MKMFASNAGSGGGSCVSAGAVVGVAVASAALGLAAGFGLCLAFQAWRRNQLAVDEQNKQLEDGASANPAPGGAPNSAAERSTLVCSPSFGTNGSGVVVPVVTRQQNLQQQQDLQQHVPQQALQMEQQASYRSITFPVPPPPPEVPESHLSGESLLSPFAFAAAGQGFASGNSTSAPPSRASSLQQPEARSVGPQGDGLGLLHAQLHPGTAQNSSGIARQNDSGSFTHGSPICGASPQRSLRPPLPPAVGGSGSGAASPGPMGMLPAPSALVAYASQSPFLLEALEPRTANPIGSSGLSAATSATLGLASIRASAAAALRSQRTASGLLPELAQFVAQREAEAASGLGGIDETSTQLLLCQAALPPRLQEWVVDPSLVSYQRWPNGKLKELGSGASSRVFLASYNGEAVAAKEVELEGSLEAQEAFLTEAMRLQALRHPHLVEFYGVCLAGSKGVVLLEFCEGRDLHSALGVMAAGGNQRVFCWHRRGRRVAFEVAKAINYLHSKGFVHMDVKSSNVLLTSGGTAKLADVALSRELAGEMLADVPLIGTFPWIAPEVLLSRECSSAVDIFSYGVLLWEIITGEQPKRGGMRMPAVPDECPQEVADLMLECLKENPAERPTAPQLLQRLSAMLERSERLTGLSRARSSAALSGGSVRQSPEGLSPIRSLNPSPVGSPPVGAFHASISGRATSN